MPRFNYLNAQRLATRLIDNFGQKTPLIRVNSTYDAITGTNVIDGFFLTTAFVVSLPASGLNSASSFDNRFNKDLKEGKIRFFYIAAENLSFKVQGGDKIFFEGQSWDIAGSTPLCPAGTHILSTIGCRIGDSSHLGETLDAIAQATEGEDVSPLDPTSSNFILNLIERIEMIESEASGEHIRFSDLPYLPNPQ